MCVHKAHMAILFSIAALLLAFTGFCVFGLPYMIVGPRMFDEFRENREQQLVGGITLTAAISLICVVISSSALISAGTHAQVIAMTFTGFGWG